MSTAVRLVRQNLDRTAEAQHFHSMFCVVENRFEELCAALAGYKHQGGMTAVWQLTETFRTVWKRNVSKIKMSIPSNVFVFVFLFVILSSALATDPLSSCSTDTAAVCSQKRDGFYAFPNCCERFTVCHDGTSYPGVRSSSHLRNSLCRCHCPTNCLPGLRPRQAVQPSDRRLHQLQRPPIPSRCHDIYSH